MRGLSLVAASGAHSSSRCTGLSLSQPLLLRSTGSRRAGSVVVAHGPSCSAACVIFPDQGSEPMSPALAGRFSTTAPPGKPSSYASNHQTNYLSVAPKQRNVWLQFTGPPNQCSLYIKSTTTSCIVFRYLMFSTTLYKG